MTKKTDVKSKAKGADTEQRVLKKIKDGNKAAKDAKDSKYAKDSGYKEKKQYKDKSEKYDKGKDSLGKRTYGNKDENKKPKAGGSGQAPILNRR